MGFQVLGYTGGDEGGEGVVNDPRFWFWLVIVALAVALEFGVVARIGRFWHSFRKRWK